MTWTTLKPLVFGLVVVGGAVGCVTKGIPKADQTRGRGSHASVANDGFSITVVSSPSPDHVASNPGDSSLLVAPPPHGGCLGTEAFVARRRPFSDIHYPTTRAPVIDSAVFPYRSLVTIECSVDILCTGWLISADVAVTAGHCVNTGGRPESRMPGQWPSDVSRLRVGYQVTKKGPMHYCGARRLYSTTGWVNDGDERYDYAAIKLDCEVGKQLGWLGFGWTASPLLGATRIAGDFLADPDPRDKPCHKA